jgi:hypothetical protein
MEKVAQKFALHTSVIFIKQPKVNNRPIGENSPKLVTLVTWYILFISIGYGTLSIEIRARITVGNLRRVCTFGGGTHV